MGVARLELVRGAGADARTPERVERALPVRVRVIDGALACIARQGMAKTTLDDVAREARCSRATVYRAFPGGKDAVLHAVVDTEVSRFFSALAVSMGGAGDLEDVLVAGMTEAATRVTEHRALQYLLAYEPEPVLSQLAFTRMDEVLAVTCAFTTPFLGRWLDQPESRRVAEWAARIVISYLVCPAEGVHLTDAGQVRRLVRLFVLPGIRALREPNGVVHSARAAGGRRRATRSVHSNPSTSTTKGEAS
ncbi:MAG TPA: helix-turn-helix domain-containing protein [Acidimicrobiales bacterium]|nr:helix-turn-helix domain-containing protein [Acidimicrobiales bacterium]